MRYLWLLMPLGAGCVTLDSFVHNPVHCTTVSEDTCDDNAWDAICTPCDEGYDWAREYPWFEETLEDGQEIRAIDPATITQYAIETADGEGTLDAYYIPPHGEDAELGAITVIYNHGNYAGIEHYQPRVRMLHEAGFGVFTWDYRGYGKSLPEYAPSPTQFLDDGKLIRDEVEAIAPDPSRIVVYANSLGTIPAVEMALHDAPCALFLEAPFVSLAAAAENATTLALGENFYSEGQFDNAAKIVDYEGPLLAMLGTLDNKFTPEQVQTMVDNAPGPKEFWQLEGVRHGIANIGVPEAGYQAYVDKMRSFLRDKAPACLPDE